jgi:putative Mg2+ transporter-C (MgtC) family protein
VTGFSLTRPVVELLQFTGNVALAALLGILIGLERQFYLHPAGLRTNALVSIGAALFVSLSYLLTDTSTTRIASYIVSGVGFLGGGAILKEGPNIRGLNTAASLWCSAAVGTLSGSGYGIHAAIGTVFVLGVLIGLRPFSRWVDRRRKQIVDVPVRYQLKLVCQSGEHATVRPVLARHLGLVPGMTVTGIKTSKPKRRKQVVVIRAIVTAASSNDRAIQDTISRLLIEPGVRSASWRKVAVPPEG